MRHVTAMQSAVMLAEIVWIYMMILFIIYPGKQK